MRPGGGKEKGSSYERAVAEILTKAYYPEGGGVFKRVESKAGKKGEKKSDLLSLKYITDPTSGEKDLILDRSFPFSIECKNYKEVKPVFCGLYAKDSEIWDWMKQAEDSAQGKMPLVIFRLFRTMHVVMFNLETWVKLHETFGEFPTRGFRISQGSPQESTRTLCFFLLSDFLEWVDFGVYRISESTRFIRSLVSKEEQ